LEAQATICHSKTMRDESNNPSALRTRARLCALIVAMWTVAGLLIATRAHASPAGHWCRQGDPPIYASSLTSCAIAGDTVTEYVNRCDESRSCRMVVSSPSTRDRVRIVCHRVGTVHEGTVRCVGGQSSGVWARFPAEV